MNVINPLLKKSAKSENFLANNPGREIQPGLLA
jgi:hypothetical protein